MPSSFAAIASFFFAASWVCITLQRAICSVENPEFSELFEFCVDEALLLADFLALVDPDALPDAEVDGGPE
jgi:hypothetical protein